MKNKLEYITNNMKSYRNRVGLSQKQTAEKLGISRITYNDYEVNPIKVKIEVFQNLADLFGCEIYDFFVEHNVTKSNNIQE